jgi:probable phosphoglycerate mutase
MDLILVRHGEAAASWGEAPDPGLSALGRQQAEDTAHSLNAKLAAETVLVSSPLQRARQTAEPLARLRQQAVQENTAFREIPSPVPLAQRQDWLRAFMQQQWAEQQKELLQWRANLLQQLLQLERPAVIFTHFLVINAVVGEVLGRAETLCFWPDNGSATHLRSDGSRLELLNLGREITTRVN